MEKLISARGRRIQKFLEQKARWSVGEKDWGESIKMNFRVEVFLSVT